MHGAHNITVKQNVIQKKTYHRCKQLCLHCCAKNLQLLPQCFYCDRILIILIKSVSVTDICLLQMYKCTLLQLKVLFFCPHHIKSTWWTNTANKTQFKRSLMTQFAFEVFPGSKLKCLASD